MTRPRSAALLIFTDEELAWEEPGGRTVGRTEDALRAPRPARARPRARRQPRTLASDLARLRSALFRRAPTLSVRDLLVAAAAALAVAVVLVVAARVTTWREAPEEASAPGAKRSAVRAPAAGSPRASARAAAAQILRRGDRGPSVRGLQEALSALGFGPQTLDGVFADSTGAAVAAFQRDRGLFADGIVGPATADALERALAEWARGEASAARRGLSQAVAAGRLSNEDAARYHSLLADSLAALDALPATRGAYLAIVLHDVAVHAPIYDEPRARALFTMLAANARYLATHSVPVTPKDIEGDEGVVYRFFRSHGFQFHPLANFAKLNKLARTGRAREAGELAAALVARGIRSGDALTWEYYFPFGGPTRWTSGLAQAAAAQALARTGALLDDDALSARAGAAYRAIPATLSLPLAGGLWVREYSFSDTAILNAQLQTLVSVSEYAEITRSVDARAVTAKLATATRALLPRFDTACWSLYSLGGASASRHYHAYHVSLLKELAAETGERLWRDAASRWGRGLRAASSPNSSAAAACSPP